MKITMIVVLLVALGYYLFGGRGEYSVYLFGEMRQVRRPSRAAEWINRVRDEWGA